MALNLALNAKQETVRAFRQQVKYLPYSKTSFILRSLGLQISVSFDSNFIFLKSICY